MMTMGAKDLRTFEKLVSLSKTSLLRTMSQFLKAKYPSVITTKDYVVAKGELPVALVAHLDTVFSTPPKQDIFYDRVKNVMWSPSGLGADDRAGVFAILNIINAGFLPTVIFTQDEELGALGAEQLVKDFPEVISDLKYIIQLDRRGSNDCVFYDCNNSKFEEYVERFGFVTNFGSFSDISEICPAWGVAGVNLSVGYYDEHHFTETLFVGQLYSTINKVKNMLRDIDKAEHFEYIPMDYHYSALYDWDYLSDSTYDLLPGVVVKKQNKKESK